MTDGRSCWTCEFQKIGGHLTFLGDCRWFAVNRGQPDKPIPPKVVDVGCKFWTERTRKQERIDFSGATVDAGEAVE